jgi:hypothetical protein
MVIGPFKETMGGVFNQWVAVGGFNIVKDLTLEAKARARWDSHFSYKPINQADVGRKPRQSPTG